MRAQRHSRAAPTWKIVVARDAYGEGADRGCLSLQCPSLLGNQDALIDTVARAQGKTVVVPESGGVSLMPWRTKVPAILQAWYPGAHGGPAVARVLFGDVDPSGRLPITYAANEGQLPTAGRRDRYPGSNAGFDTHYSEGRVRRLPLVRREEPAPGVPVRLRPVPTRHSGCPDCR